MNFLVKNTGHQKSSCKIKCSCSKSVTWMHTSAKEASSCCRWNWHRRRGGQEGSPPLPQSRVLQPSGEDSHPHGPVKHQNNFVLTVTSQLQQLCTNCNLPTRTIANFAAQETKKQNFGSTNKFDIWPHINVVSYYNV